MDSLNLPAILTPDLGLLFWMLLAFLVVFGVLAKFGFPAIIGMVEERKKFIDESLKNAHEAAERLANIQQESEAIVQQARVQQADIIDIVGLSIVEHIFAILADGLTVGLQCSIGLHINVEQYHISESRLAQSLYCVRTLTTYVSADVNS